MDRRKLRMLGGLGAVLLASLLLVAPASADDGDNKHPSGKDRSVEKGGSGTQGNSASDPDGDSNGGADKPNGSGGVDLDDQDGNNGCGNDDDFEDDNNGNCGPKDKDKDKKKGGPCVDNNGKANGKANGKGKAKGKNNDKSRAARCDDVESGNTPDVDDVEGDATSTDEDDDVLGGVIDGDTEADDDDADVLGTRVSAEDAAAAAERESSGSALPFTGGAILGILALGVGLVTSGYLFMRHRRPSHK